MSPSSPSLHAGGLGRLTWLLLLPGCWITDAEIDAARIAAPPSLPRACPGGQLGGEPVQLAFDPATNSFDSLCLPDGNPDVVLEWVGEDAGCQVFFAPDASIALVDDCDAVAPVCAGPVAIIPVDKGTEQMMVIEQPAGASTTVETFPLVEAGVNNAATLDGDSTDAMTLSTRTCGGEPTGADQYVRWSTSTGGLYRFSVEPEAGTGDLSIHLQTGCGPESEAICANERGPGQLESIEYDTAVGDVLWIRIGSIGSGGPWELSVEGPIP